MMLFLYPEQSLLFPRIVEVSLNTAIIIYILVFTSYYYYIHWLFFLVSSFVFAFDHVEVREYLDGLKTYDDTAMDDINASTIVADEQSTDNLVDESVVENVKPNVGDGRDFERWLFTDWLNKPDAKGGRQKEPALPILKEAKWNSGDNPVLVTAAIMMLGVVLASITERIAT